MKACFGGISVGLVLGILFGQMVYYVVAMRVLETGFPVYTPYRLDPVRDFISNQQTISVQAIVIGGGFGAVVGAVVGGVKAILKSLHMQQLSQK